MLLAVCFALVVPLNSFAEDEAEQKIYQEMHSEVKTAFDNAKDKFTNLYDKVSSIRSSVTNWREATTKRTQNASIKDINDLFEGELVAGRDELLKQVLSEEFVEQMKKVEAELGIQIGIPDTEKLLKMLVDKQGREKLYGYMYQLSGYERNLRKSGVFEKLDKLKDRFAKGSEYIDKVGDMLDFVALFDPSNVDPDSPITSLKAIGNVLGAMKDITEAIPGFGHLLDFYIDATEQFTQALDELNTRILDARDGSICGQLGVLSAELKALDEHIKGGSCINFYTNYELQSLLKPVLVWTHAESKETFFYDKDHDVAAYLTSGNQPDLLDPFRALKSSKIASNSKRASPAVFMALARVVTRSKVIVAKPECDDYAQLFSDRSFRAILRQFDVLDHAGAVRAPSGTVLQPAITRSAEISGLCLYDPRMRRLMRDLADRYRHLASVTIDVYPRDREQSPDVSDVRIDGIPLVFGEAGAGKRRVAEFTRIEALVDTRHPLSVEVDAEGFKPALKSLSLSAKRRFATIYMEREKAAQAVPEADTVDEADTDGKEDAAGKADAEVDQPKVEVEPAVKQVSPAPVAPDRPQPVSPQPVPQEPEQPPAQQATAPDAPAQPAEPAGDVPGPETAGDVPAVAAGTEADVDAGTDDAGDVDVPPESAKVGIKETGTDQAADSVDAPEQPSTDQTVDGSAAEAGEDAAGAGNEVAPSAPGSDNIVGLTIARGQVYLGDTIQISTPYRGEDIAGGSDECDPNSTNPFTGCEVTPSGTSGASVYIGPADDTEDLGPARPLPSLEYIWHGSEGVTFEPTTSNDGRTFATFERIGEMKIWAQVVKQGSTIAETEQQTVSVLAPSLSIRFDPASGAKAGSKIKATVVATPMVLPKYWTVRWLEPPTADREELNDNGSEIRFSGAAGKPVTLEATANVAFYGDEIGSVTGSYSLDAGSLDVTARSRGPRPQIWDRASGGLVDLPDGQYVDGQEIDLRAEFAGGDAPADVRWRWSVNDGTSISNEISQTPTVSRSQAGQIDAKVMATDKNGVELASGSISLSVQAQEQPPTDKSGSVASKPAPVPDAADTPDSQPLTQRQDPARPIPAPATPAPVAKQPATAAPASPTTSPTPVEPASPPPDSTPPQSAPPQPAPPQPAPPPAAAACAIGSPKYTAAVELWTRGLSMISAGNAEVGLEALEASLVVCPDPTRQAQFTNLRQQLGGAGATPSQAPLPAVDCSSGGRDYVEAMSHWQQGLSLLGAGDHKVGVVALERSLEKCPDLQRQSQLDRLKTQLEAAAAPQSGEAGACLPGGDRYASAEDAWRRGIALISGGESGAGVALLEMSVGDCPDDTRQSQLEALRQQLNISEENGDEVAGDAGDPSAPTSIEDAVKQAVKDCEPGGARYADAEASWIRGSDLLGAGDRTGGLEALRKSVAICADPDRVANLEQVTVLIEEAIVREQQAQADAQRQAEEAARQAADAERAAQQAPQPVEPKSMDAPSTPQPTRYSGSVEGAPLCRLSFEFSNGQVNGQITGTYEGDQINLTFQGNADGNQFSVPLSGYLIDSSGRFGRVSITGTVRGAFANGFFTGSWTAGNNYQSDRGGWIASPE
ncbi:hypothetical protein [Hoeflea alexandrii]|uniref:PKD domain-containing protein n=2 Tax=Hoeflea alexandrii TaxID=288436 RepID=A0ABT1CKR3_9HYPH|nr:hypothetical protein [Hoeflea alexandrii]